MATVQVRVRIPAVPKVLTLEGAGERGMTLPVQNFTEADLRAVGAEWTERLIEESKKKAPPRRPGSGPAKPPEV